MTWVEITYVFLCIIFAYLMKYFLEKGMVMKRLIIGCPMLQTTYNPANGRSQGAIFESKVNLNNNIVTDTEIIYAQPKSVINLTINLDPDVTPDDNLKASISWSVSGMFTTITPNESKLGATFILHTMRQLKNILNLPRNINVILMICCI